MENSVKNKKELQLKFTKDKIEHKSLKHAKKMIFKRSWENKIVKSWQIKNLVVEIVKKPEEIINPRKKGRLRVIIQRISIIGNSWQLRSAIKC